MIQTKVYKNGFKAVDSLNLFIFCLTLEKVLFKILRYDWSVK